MPGKLSAADVKLLWASGIVGALLLTATALLAPAAQRGNSPVPSSYSPDPDGALAAYLLLGDLKIPAQRSEQSPTSLADAPADAVLILAEPSQHATDSERQALLSFVRRGGRVLFCGGSLEGYLPLSPTQFDAAAEITAYEPTIPSPLVRRANAIRMRPRARLLTGAGQSVALYGKPGDPVAVSEDLGEGQVIWWAAAFPLTNDGISQADNLQLFLNAISHADGSARPVFWDEYFHGEQGSLWSYVARTPIPFGLWQLALIAVALLFSFSRRSGPTVPPALRSRLSPMEFVDTMGDLYNSADAAPFAVHVPYRRLRLQLARRLGRSPALPDTELVRGSARFSLAEGELLDTLQQAAHAVQALKVPAKQALDLVQRLAGYLNLVAPPGLSEEKKER